jgi:hypothetical protein
MARRFSTAFFVILCAALAVPRSVPAQPEFIRGDVNDSGAVNISDAVCALSFLFDVPGSSCANAACPDALDANDSGAFDLADPIATLAYLFAGAVPPPPPFPGCGADPTAGDPLTCSGTAVCGGGGPVDSFVLEVVPELTLHSIWSEAYTTLEVMHEHLSVIRFRAGEHEIFLDRRTEDVGLIESLVAGPSLAPAEPLDGGTFTPFGFRPYTHEYRQRFMTPQGPMTFLLQLGIRREKNGIQVLVLDCERLDGRPDDLPALVFRAEWERAQTLYFSCFLPEGWRAARRADPVRLTLEDGTDLALYLHDSYMFRGVVGETANRRLVRAEVDRGGAEFSVEDPVRLIYAGVHHNWNQECRVVFPVPVAGVHGIDVVECPEDPFPCPQGFSPGTSRGFLLDSALERVEELGITTVTWSP